MNSPANKTMHEQILDEVIIYLNYKIDRLLMRYNTAQLDGQREKASRYAVMIQALEDVKKKILDLHRVAFNFELNKGESREQIQDQYEKVVDLCTRREGRRH